MLPACVVWGKGGIPASLMSVTARTLASILIPKKDAERFGATKQHSTAHTRTIPLPVHSNTAIVYDTASTYGRGTQRAQRRRCRAGVRRVSLESRLHRRVVLRSKPRFDARYMYSRCSSGRSTPGFVSSRLASS